MTLAFKLIQYYVAFCRKNCRLNNLFHDMPVCNTKRRHNGLVTCCVSVNCTVLVLSFKILNFRTKWGFENGHLNNHISNAKAAQGFKF